MSKEFKYIEALPPSIRGLIFAYSRDCETFMPAIRTLEYYLKEPTTGILTPTTCEKLNELLELKSARVVLCELVDLMLVGEEDEVQRQNLLQFKFDKEIR